MNKPTISPLAKKRFINWFLENWELRGDAPQKILSYLQKHDSNLNNVKIIENGSFLRPLLVISSIETPMPPSLLITYKKIITKTADILKYLSGLKKEQLYLTLYFPGRENCLPFLDILEEIPIPLEEEKIKSFQIDLEILLLTEEAKNEEIRNKIMTEIDQALATGQKDKFLRLAKELKKI